MAKIILKTSLASNNYTVEHKVITTPINKLINVEFVELLISPKFGFNIDAKDFSHGSLHSNVSTIQYTNTQKTITSSNKVIAKVYFSNTSVKLDVLSIFLPISAVARVDENKFTLTDQTSADANVIVQTSSFGTVESGGPNLATYSFVNKTGNILVLRKTFSVPHGYYFKQEPTYKISGGGSGYKVITKTSKDDKGYMVSKSFDVSYNFPKTSPTFENVDTISFIANSYAIETPLQEIVATKKEDFKIYSIDTGRKIGVKGGIKKIVVKGIPGTPFKILTQNTDKKVYNYKTGAFTTGGKFLEGVIPPVRPGEAFGTFKAAIKVPASATANAITTRIVTDNPITSIQGITSATSTTQLGGSIVVEETVDIQTSMTVELNETGEAHFVIDRYLLYSDADTASAAQISAGYITDGTYTIGPGTTNQTIDTWEDVNPIISYNNDVFTNYKFRVSTASDDEYIRLHRQPKFKPSGTFVAWDSYYSDDSTKLKSHNNAGTEITTDWGNIGVSTDTDASATAKLGGWSLGSADAPGINATVVTLEDGIGCSDCSPEVNLSSYVDIYITVTGTFGTFDINPELRLWNFLSIEN